MNGMTDFSRVLFTNNKKLKRIRILSLATAGVIMLSLGRGAQSVNCYAAVTAQQAALLPADDPAALGVPEASAIAENAYVYGYSLVATEVTRIQMTNVTHQEGMRGPMGQFVNALRFTSADDHGVSGPNADLLYSLAWLDVGPEPMVLTYPDMGKRYFLFPMYSLWMPIIGSPGSRTTGEKGSTYLITGPNWTGVVPTGMTQVKSPTRYLLILGRTQTDASDEDYKTVNALQAQYDLRPLSAYGMHYNYVAPPVDPNPGFSMTDKPQQVILNMSTAEYFNMMAKLMGDAAPPASEDTPMVAQMARIGLVPGKPFDITKLNPAVQAALQNVPQTALANILALQKTGGKLENGWLIPASAGTYGTDYLGRALIATVGWPGNLPEDAVYTTALMDSNSHTFNGVNRYTLTFPKGLTPPVNGFWSISMYYDDNNGWWSYPNALNKFSLSMSDHPKFNPDGSLTLYFQHASPGVDKEANWLPAPAGNFILTMRMYWPQELPPSILPSGEGTWTPPGVVRLTETELGLTDRDSIQGK
jgi:hypothetical protein